MFDMILVNSTDKKEAYSIQNSYNDLQSYNTKNSYEKIELQKKHTMTCKKNLQRLS